MRASPTSRDYSSRRDAGGRTRGNSVPDTCHQRSKDLLRRPSRLSRRPAPDDGWGNPMSQLDEAVPHASAPLWRLPISYEAAGYALGAVEFLSILTTGVSSHEIYGLLTGSR